MTQLMTSNYLARHLPKSQFLALLAWTLWGITLVLALVAGGLQWMTQPGATQADRIELLAGWAYLLDGLTVASVGALIAARRPQHPIGWLLCVTGLATNGEAFSQQYAIYTFIFHPGVLPGEIFVLWLSQWLWVIPNTLLCLVLMLFPTGRLLVAGWRWIARVIVAGGMGLLVLAAFNKEMTFTTYPNLIRNPIGLFALHDADLIWPFTLYSGWALLAALSALIWRFYRAQGVEQQQMKWFALAALFQFVVGFLLEVVFPGQTWSGLAENLTVLGLPIAIGIAILQHRLFDIDLIIRRTLLYTLLTGLLLAIYFGAVIVLQRLVQGMTGQGQNPFVTVLSTLLIAGLFVPLRRQIQQGIDRRFYRRRYNAEQVLTDFGTILRDEVELEHLTVRLLAVIDETLQPQAVSLWLKKQ